MLRIRLSRVGKRKQPAYRIVVADSRAPREGAFLKIIGHYNPRTEPVTLDLKEDEAVYWLQKGARPSDTAAKLLTRLGMMERAGRPPVRYVGKQVPPGEKKTKGEAAAATAQTAAPAPEGEETTGVAAAEEPPAVEEPAAKEEPAAAAEEPAAEEPGAKEAPAEEPASGVEEAEEPKSEAETTE